MSDPILDAYLTLPVCVSDLCPDDWEDDLYGIAQQLLAEEWRL